MTRQSKINDICNHVQDVFNPPQIRFLKIARYPEAYGMRIGFEYRNGTKTITFSQHYINAHPAEHFRSFLDPDKLSKLRKTGDQHLELI
ncbi:MAG: hypothetical protein KKG47_01230 [Proteobacteria bacterium]|nr:hypothetical protein [Pseudomonadota bacterium]MBU1736689.1 hypothetical protein [Pseudomonadota bacterium]